MDLVSLEHICADELLKVRYNHIKVWFLIRTKFKVARILSETGYHSNIRTRNKTILLRNIFYGIFNMFRLKKFSYYFFANTNKRYLIDDKYIDIYFDKIAEILGQDQSLFIEFAEKEHISHKKIYSKNAMSDLPFKLLGSIFSMFVNTGKIKNLQILNEISQQNELKINVKTDVKQALGQYLIYRLLFKIFKPKYIFVICYYSKLPIILAAKECKIPVYEAQHGIINENNDLYNSIFSKSKDYFPDFLLSYGTDLIENYKTEFLFKKDAIIPIGHYYLNYIKDKFTDEKLNTLKTKFKKVVCVTSQGIYFEKLMEFVQILSKKNSLYLFVLRLKRDENPEMYLSDNVITLNDYDIYKILKYSDFNITVYSMVALEADFLNVYNILLNINGLSKKYFSNDLKYTVVEPDQIDLFEFPLNTKRKSNLIFQYQKSGYLKNISEFCSNLQ